MAAAKPYSHASPSLKVSDGMDPRHVAELFRFIGRIGLDIPVTGHCNAPRFYSTFHRSFLTVDHIQRGRISCSVVVKPPLCNAYGTLHGGAVATLVEDLTTACARTVVAEDKELFLGEISISYLSSIPVNEEVVANASVVKSGRNLTVVSVEFKAKKTGNSVYIGHATLYNMPLASL